VLWFDECYDETHFRFQSTLAAAHAARLLIVIGTSGSTNLPMQVATLASRRATPMIVVNAEPSPFSALAEGNPNGHFIHGTAGDHVPMLLNQLVALYDRP
jgi:NAD-dependent deacetylase